MKSKLLVMYLRKAKSITKIRIRSNRGNTRGGTVSQADDAWVGAVWVGGGDIWVANSGCGGGAVCEEAVVQWVVEVVEVDVEAAEKLHFESI